MLDTNVLVSAAMRSGSLPERAFLTARACGTVALSAQVMVEYREVLNRPRFERIIGAGRVGEMLDLMVVGAMWVEPYERVGECRDAKDNVFLELALHARAICIVSGDQDLLVLHPWRGINIVSPADFLSTYSAEARLEARVDDLIRRHLGDEAVDEARTSFMRRNLKQILSGSPDDGEEGRAIEGWSTPWPNR